MVGNLLRVKGDPDRFGVTGVTVADVCVGGIRHLPTGIAGFHGEHTGKFVKYGFQAPETASSQGCHFRFIIHASLFY
jgi:hypothetical protein